MPWNELGLDPTLDERAIKRAYAARLKHTRPEDDAAAFGRLRDAYEAALHWARWQQHEAEQAQAATEAAEPVADAAQHAPAADTATHTETVLEPDPAVVQTVWWREQAGAQTNEAEEPAWLALRRAAHERDYPDEELAADAERYGWLDVERAQPGPAEWLLRARFRLYHLYTDQLIRQLVSSGSEDAALARLPELLQWPLWEVLDARAVLEQCLADWLGGFEDTPLRLVAALAQWGGWLDAEGYARAGLSRPVLWLCERLRQESVWQDWQTMARERGGDPATRQRSRVFGAVLLPSKPWQRWLAGYSGQLAAQVRHLLDEIEYAWPALFARLDPEMLAFWRGPQAGWANPPAFLLLPVLLCGLGGAGLLSYGLGELEGISPWAWLLLWLGTFLGCAAGTLWLGNLARYHWPRKLASWAETRPVLHSALANGFAPLSGALFALLASLIFSALFATELGAGALLLGVALAILLYGARFAVCAWPERCLPLPYRQARAAGFRPLICAGIGLAIGLIGAAPLAAHEDSTQPATALYWALAAVLATVFWLFAVRHYAGKPPRQAAPSGWSPSWWWLVWGLMFLAPALSRMLKG